jgi:hypothetical protein
MWILYIFIYSQCLCHPATVLKSTWPTRHACLQQIPIQNRYVTIPSVRSLEDNGLMITPPICEPTTTPKESNNVKDRGKNGKHLHDRNRKSIIDIGSGR